MLEFFGAKDGRASSRAVRTKQELKDVLRLHEYLEPTSIQVSMPLKRAYISR